MPETELTGALKAAKFIDGAKKAGFTHATMVRKLFSFDHPHVFEDKLEVAFDIFNRVAIQFRVPINHVKAVGSAQIGYSFFKQKAFMPRVSDFDLAIIDGPLFQQYCEHAYRITKGYTDLTSMPRVSGMDLSVPFFQNIARGYFAPDQMPSCFERDSWNRFFTGMSSKHSTLFRNINCGIYFSDMFFESKQSLVIEKYLEAKV